MTPVLPRVGGRLLLIDPAERLLLIHERLESEGNHWLTPGGGVEPGEHPRDAAVREAAEEIGYDATIPSDAEPVLITRRTWAWSGTTYDQTDHFFAVRVPHRFEPAPRHLTPPERWALLGHRWWSADELLATSETLLPVDLGDVLTGLLGASGHGA